MIKITLNGNVRYTAFATINRTVNQVNVKSLFEMMQKKGYREAEPVQVLKAEEATKEGGIALVGLDGNPIANEDADKYYLVIDGQHRIMAAVRYNEYLQQEKQQPIQVPAVEVHLKNEETISEYLNEINLTKKPWRTEDYVKGAANTKEDNLLLCRYKELIKCDSNPNGFPLSTLNLIFFSDKQALVSKDFAALCKGEETKGRAQKNIIGAFNLKVGNQFIQICKDKGFTPKDYTKRYLIEAFNAIKQETGSADQALKIFNAINPNDVTAMRNGKKTIDENMVSAQIQEIRKRVS